LERRIEGIVSGKITIVDETTGLAAILNNQSGVLLELQDALPKLELEPVPDGCDRCVHFSYELPIDGNAGEGWLRDPVMLASVENYMAANLAPHFPPGTVLGLRRSATAYDVAHSLALTDDGSLWRWLVTDDEVPAPVPVDEVAPDLPGLLADLPLDALAEEYVTNCPAVPVETLYLDPDATADEGKTITILCPAFSLPSTLLPLYLTLDDALQEVLSSQGIPRPPLQIPLSSMLDFQRDDGAQLTLLADGRAIGRAPEAGIVVTETLTAAEVVSVTVSLAQSGVLTTGVEAYAADEANNILLIRAEQGMMEFAWNEEEEIPAALTDDFATLDALLDRMLEVAEPEEDGDVGPEPERTGTATTTPAPGATLTPAPTALPEGTATPTP
jgi:hypothetical protein